MKGHRHNLTDCATIVSNLSYIREIHMKKIIIALCLCVAVVMPVTISAEVSGEIVIAHPLKARELWVTHLNVGGTTRQIYEHDPEPNFRILDIVTQKNGKYTAFLARSGDEATGIHLLNIYITNKFMPDKQAVNITQDRFGEIFERDFDISKNGDVIFACKHPPDGVKKGVYLIPQSEFLNDAPRATLIALNAFQPSWLPDGERVAFVEHRKIYVQTIDTGERVIFDLFGNYPTVSPDGRYMVVGKTFFGAVYQIEIYSLPSHNLIDKIEPTFTEFLADFKWSPDGGHIVVTTLVGRRRYAFPFDRRTRRLGTQEAFLDQGIFDQTIVTYDWTHVGAYLVEPVDRLTTLWGKIKQ